MGLVAALYRAMGRMPPVPRGRVHLCDLRELETRVAGITLAGKPATVHDWLQAHATPALDLLCAVPYATFLGVCVAFAVFASLRDPARGARFAWGFLVLNLLGFVTYRAFPAAPPWYFHAHGCVVDLATTASEGPNLARVDGWLGVRLFAAMYARSSAVFGAMPSLHCAYATLVALEGWSLLGRRGRAVLASYVGLMAFSAVYLDHHWILDVLAGGVLAALVFVSLRWASARRASAVAQPA